MGSCRVSNKANDAAWVVEEGYFNSALSLADKGEFGRLYLASLCRVTPPTADLG